MKTTSTLDPKELVAERFRTAGIANAHVELRAYPDETIVIVYVEDTDVAPAIIVANDLDRFLAENGFSGFVTVKKRESGTKTLDKDGQDARINNLRDARVDSLVNLLTARSRTSEIQPSLAYINNAQNFISVVTAPRHHIIYGRRGAGKTALLAETKRLLEHESHLTAWINVQTFRHETAGRLLLYVCQRFCELIQSHCRDREPQGALSANQILLEIESLLAKPDPTVQQVQRMIPRVQAMLRRFLEKCKRRVYLFLDDFHYLQLGSQALFLDMIHGCVRDCDAWLKIAAIEHLSRCFDPTQHIGLETGHDAARLNLDVTLQDPRSAKNFLEQVLLSYAKHCGIQVLSNAFGRDSLDRLVLASGAVPRDYLLLCAKAIQQAQQRENSRQVGVQDVNKAAGDAKQAKIAELEDDAASANGDGERMLQALNLVRAFCIDEKSWTAFRVDFRDKEAHGPFYNLLVGLMDLRLIHLADPSLSDEHHAGHRSEVYLLDLSQYAGQRLKKHLHVLDFAKGFLVLRETGTQKADRVGNTANKRLSILRRAPLLMLEAFRKVVQ